MEDHIGNKCIIVCFNVPISSVNIIYIYTYIYILLFVKQKVFLESECKTDVVSIPGMYIFNDADGVYMTGSCVTQRVTLLLLVLTPSSSLFTK